MDLDIFNNNFEIKKITQNFHNLAPPATHEIIERKNDGSITCRACGSEKDLKRLFAVSRELLGYSQTADFKKIKSDLDDNKNKMEELKTPLINILNKINRRPILEDYCKFIED